MSNPGRLVFKCVVPTCQNAYFCKSDSPNYRNKHFFTLSNNRKTSWLLVLAKNFPNFNSGNAKVHICEDHFRNECFTRTDKSRLHKIAVPTIFRTLESDKVVEKTGRINILQNILLVPNSNEKLNCPVVPNYNENLESSQQIEHISTKRKSVSPVVENVVVKKMKLNDKNEIKLRVKDLTPRKRKLYLAKKKIKNNLSKVKKRLFKTRQQLKNKQFLSGIETLENRFDVSAVEFLKAQLKRNNNKRGVWSKKLKIFCLALYKRGPRAYRFLQKYFHLPSKNTISSCFKNVMFNVGINRPMLDRLKFLFDKLNPLDKYVSLAFDEIQLSSGLEYCRSSDEILGFVDLGNERHNKLAKHALVFMIQGLRTNFKQPIAFYYTENTISSYSLQKIIVEVIKELQRINIVPIVVICDQAPTNRRAIKGLLSPQNEDNYFLVNNQKVFCVYDVPHLLKNTRNSLFKYDILYKENRQAKFHHILDCFKIDKTKKFQMLRRLREEYLRIDKFTTSKMKVSVAAKTLSYTVAAALEAMCSGGQLPSEAIHTAEFVAEIDSLFDSLNSSGNFREPKVLRRPLTEKSRHLNFWKDAIAKIETWKFVQIADQRKIKTIMPFKQGWIHTLKSMIGLWNELKIEGFQFLRTRAVNQDCLENLFATIRQYSAGNTTPNCFQFVSAFKTAILNNLAFKKSLGTNCEIDNNNLLDNLQNFLCNFSRIQNSIPNIETTIEIDDSKLPVSLDEKNFDTQAIAYVCGFIIKKIDISKCDTCKNNLCTTDILNCHSFVIFKEYDEKTRLIYASQYFVNMMSRIHDVVFYILRNFGHLKNIKTIITNTLKIKIDTSWFTCHLHHEEVINKILNKCTLLLIKKFCDDQNREIKINRTKYTKNKLNILKK